MLHAVTRLLDKEVLDCDKDGSLTDYVLKQMQNEIANIDGYCSDLNYFVPCDFFCKKGKEKDI